MMARERLQILLHLASGTPPRTQEKICIQLAGPSHRTLNLQLGQDVQNEDVTGTTEVVVVARFV
jgi:hypothetical protein